MKKIMLRVLLVATLLILAAIVTCFYLGYFMQAYFLIFIILAVLFAMGQVANLNNNVWLHRNSYERRMHEEAERYRHERED
ncbi:hypothetical protein [Paenibacillus hunanensis]|uniref:ABC-type transport system involved in cytochrome bd biosynthesis fused ATPase/permease subunit n=1 Tax=Paenibacillus hunanensis TaxID=539262 RepID=A0ABU1IUC0_9BACL|nr:hypothetical protein [Paenibacillus hunanensis]MDR6242859.1 ABC-type transport system involved in cytochrome bd biosynthesis fused ATPase/permease subunit [Paenibacillus hunanensis]WPP41786.1 hypothetical protein SK066_02145 [Paenibacillus hunanensis]GGJ03274.1 hypothetical protein GCM10008022_10340 [Paenibacillus hunanensis]